MKKIDFVVLWVDPDDMAWRTERRKYERLSRLDDTPIDNSEERYRDWENFKYWFRGVEQYAPWVNKIHLVTCGHTPSWLNIKHPKLNIVKHSDFMPKDALPTFNSNAIELCIHKIPGLSEHFVLFNDDMFITRPVKPTDFFDDDQPRNTMSLFALMPVMGSDLCKTVLNDISIINKHFDFSFFKKHNVGKIISLRQREWIAFTYPSLLYNRFVGFRNFHIPISYNKTTFERVWSKEYEILDRTVHSRFRGYDNNVSHWLMNYWQFASGNFKQRNSHFGISVAINSEKAPVYVSEQKYHLLCLNDADKIENPESVKAAIIEAFDTILADKSSFEI